MTMTDPVADLLTRIRNAVGAKHEAVNVPASRMSRAIVRILKEEGYVDTFAEPRDDKPGFLQVRLRYGAGKEPVISSLERISRPGCRIYARKSEIPQILGGLGICIVSTSRGLMTGREAQSKGLGGEVLCSIC